MTTPLESRLRKLEDGQARGRKVLVCINSDPESPGHREATARLAALKAAGRDIVLLTGSIWKNR